MSTMKRQLAGMLGSKILPGKITWKNIIVIQNQPGKGGFRQYKVDITLHQYKFNEERQLSRKPGQYKIHQKKVVVRNV